MPGGASSLHAVSPESSRVGTIADQCLVRLTYLDRAACTCVRDSLRSLLFEFRLIIDFLLFHI